MVNPVTTEKETSKSTTATGTTTKDSAFIMEKIEEEDSTTENVGSAGRFSRATR